MWKKQDARMFKTLKLLDDYFIALDEFGEGYDAGMSGAFGTDYMDWYSPVDQYNAWLSCMKEDAGKWLDKATKRTYAFKLPPSAFDAMSGLVAHCVAVKTFEG